MISQINESVVFLKSLGTPLPDWFLTILILLALLGIVIVPLMVMNDCYKYSLIEQPAIELFRGGA